MRPYRLPPPSAAPRWCRRNAVRCGRALQENPTARMAKVATQRQPRPSWTCPPRRLCPRHTQQQPRHCGHCRAHQGQGALALHNDPPPSQALTQGKRKTHPPHSTAASKVHAPHRHHHLATCMRSRNNPPRTPWHVGARITSRTPHPHAAVVHRRCRDASGPCHK